MTDHNKMLNPVYLMVSARVRYWEDASVNDMDDTDGTMIPFRDGDCWCPVIRLSDGYIKDWPQGVTASIHYKVCDEGEYWLADSQLNKTKKLASYYVPDDLLCHGDNGYGDYIIFKVNGEGFIEGYKFTGLDDDEWEAI